MPEPITTIATVLGGVKTAWDFAKQRADELKDHQLSQQLSEIGSKIMDLQAALIAMQQEHSALVQAKDEAETEVKRLRDWSVEAAKYKLHAPSSGVFVYSEQENREPTTEAPWLCAKCYQDREKSILHLEARSEYDARYFCPSCETRFNVALKERTRTGRHTVSNGWQGHI